MTRVEAKKTLGLSDQFTFEELKTAFRKMAMLTHPDKGGSIREFLNVQAAYEFLKEKGDFVSGEAWQETPEELKQRLRDIVSAFESLSDGFAAVYQIQVENFKKYLFGSLRRLDSTSKIKDHWHSTVLSGWENFNAKVLRHLQMETSQIASVFDHWLTEKLKFSIETAKTNYLKRRFRSGRFYVPFVLFVAIFSAISYYAYSIFDMKSTVLLILLISLSCLVSFGLSWVAYDEEASKRFRVDNLIPQLEIQSKTFEYGIYVYNLTHIRTQDESAAGGAVTGANFGFMIGGLMGAVVGGVLGGILGGIFGTPIGEIHQAVYEDTLSKLGPELFKTYNEFMNGINEIKMKYLRQAEENFKTASDNAIKLLTDKT